MPGEPGPTYLLIHSPLVGAGTWGAVRSWMVERGTRAVVPSLSPVMAGEPPYFPNLIARIVERVSEPTANGGIAIVCHSGAGALVPAVADALGARATAIVYVDATLPRPGASWIETAPAALAERLRAMAVDGRLPPWNTWFPRSTMEALLPDPAKRARFIAELPRVPLAYFEERTPAATAAGVPAGYLQLSAAYQDAADEAEAAGWPTVRIEADHLAVLTKPGLVGEHILALAAALTSS